MAAGPVFELKTYRALPGKLDALATLARVAGAPAARAHAALVGQWTTQDQELGQLVELWRYEDFDARARGLAALGADRGWRQFLRRARPLLRDFEPLILLAADVWEVAGAATSPVYELRDYRLHPGKTAGWLECWARGMTVRRNFSQPLGIWYSEIGELNRVVHVWPYDSLQHRHAVRQAAIEDPVWRDTVATLATMMQRMESKILVPTGAGAWK